MKARGKLQLVVYFLGSSGAALFTILLIHQGASGVGGTLANAGWGIAAVAIFHFVPIFLDAGAWWVLFPKIGRPRLRSLFWMRWIGESVSNLVPSAMVGGDLVRARLVSISGTPMPAAVASVIVDITIGVPMQILFTLLGLSFLVSATEQIWFGPHCLALWSASPRLSAFTLFNGLGCLAFSPG
jgi:hypothetical protein